MDIYKYLSNLKIDYVKMEHKPVSTVKEALFIEETMNGEGVKNLFLKNANHNYYLYVIKSNKRADLKALANYLNSSKLYFGNEVELNKYLGLKPGAVSLLGIINDSGKVKIIIDSDLVGKRLLMHPNINTVTLSIAYNNVLKIIEDCKNDYIIF